MERISDGLASEDEVVIITSRPYQGIASLSCQREKKNNLNIYRFYPFNIYHAFRAKQQPGILKPLWHLIDTWNPHTRAVVNKILESEKPDLIHTHNLNGFSLSIISAIKKSRAAWVHTCHDYSLLCPYATLPCAWDSKEKCLLSCGFCPIYRTIKRILLGKGPDTVIFPSRSTRDIYCRHHFFNKAHAEILPYCVKDNKQEPGARGSRSVFNILYVGQLVKHKGVQLLLEALKGLSIDNFNLHIVGDGEYREQLEKISPQDNRIIFHGQLSNAQTLEFYRSADLLVVPSLWPEVLGIVILEALSAGVPVVASDQGGIKEVIKDNFNGLLFNPDKPLELRERLNLLLSSPAILQRLKQNCKESAREFSLAQHLDRLRKIYMKSIMQSVKNRGIDAHCSN
jgi:glycosyltransferase involved in cell wall biosynthesis